VFHFGLERPESFFNQGKLFYKSLALGVEVKGSLGEGVSEHHRDVFLRILLVRWVLLNLVQKVVGKFGHGARLDIAHVEFLSCLVEDLFFA
jgi:hypothetical protein